MRTLRNRGFTLIELMVVVAIIGVLAAVAIPTFMRYLAKAKTTEARSQLQKMYSQARVYYLETFGASAAGKTVPHQFPHSEALTPATACCIDLGDGDKCAPSAALWTSPTWIGLHFSLDDAHYYQYEYISSGVSTQATFTARAEGDLDCDGVRSVFEMYGRVDSQGGEITGSAGVARIRELE